MLLNQQDTELAYADPENLMLLEEEDDQSESMTRIASSNPASGKCKRGRKRIMRESKIQMILNNLPTGVTYIGRDGGLTEENVMAYVKNPIAFSQSIKQWEDECLFERPQSKNKGDDSFEKNANIEQVDSKTLRIGLFEIDLDAVTVKGLILMRRILPKDEYRLIKNRKCARVSRQKRKEKTTTLADRLAQLEAENKKLRMKILNLECNKSVMSSKGSMSSCAIQSSDESSSHNNSAYSEPIAMRWRSESSSMKKQMAVAAAAAKDPKTMTNAQRTTEDLLVRPFMKPAVKLTQTPPLHKDQFIAPPKISMSALLSPCKPHDKPYQSSFAAFGENMKLPMLPALIFPLLSQEETAEVQPLSPLSGSSSSGRSGNHDDAFPNLMSWQMHQ